MSQTELDYITVKLDHEDGLLSKESKMSECAYKFGELIEMKDGNNDKWYKRPFIAMSQNGDIFYLHVNFNIDDPGFLKICRCSVHRKALPALKVDAKVLVQRRIGGVWHKRHFSHFADDGTMFCFEKYGGTSWASHSTCSWDIWKLPSKSDLDDCERK